MEGKRKHFCYSAQEGHQAQSYLNTWKTCCNIPNRFIRSGNSGALISPICDSFTVIDISDIIVLVPLLRACVKMGMKFLNKKGWHTGSLRNIENVWKAEQKHEQEQKKLEELRKQILEERERAEFRQLQEQAGLVP